MFDIINQLSNGKEVTIETSKFKSLKIELNSLELGFKVAASVGKLKTILKKL